MELPEKITIDEDEFITADMQPGDQGAVIRIQELRMQLNAITQQANELNLLISSYGGALKNSLTAVQNGDAETVIEGDALQVADNA